MTRTVTLPEPGVDIPEKRKQVLEYLINATEPMTRSDLITGCACGKSTVVYLLNALIEKNQVSRTVVERPGGKNNASDNIFYGYQLRAKTKRLYARLIQEQNHRKNGLAQQRTGSVTKKPVAKKKAASKKKAAAKKKTRRSAVKH